MKSFKKWTALLAGLAAGSVFGPASAQDITLKLSHYVPTVLGLHTEFMEPWARDLEACSGGTVAVEISGAGTALGNVARQYDQARSGVVDIAFGLNGIPRGRFPRTSLIEIPFIVDSASAATKALWEIFPEHLAEEYPDVKVLALTAHNPGLINTKTPVNKPEDLAGLRIRTPSPSVSAMLESLDADPVGMPPGEMYENLSKGTLDGATIGWTGVGAFKLYEVTKHHLDAGIYTVSFFFVMNQKSYDTLPENARNCIDDSTGDVLVERLGELWDSWDAAMIARVDAESDGNAVKTLGTDDRQVWIDRLAPVRQQLIDGVEAAGVSNVNEIYEALLAAIDKHN